MKRFLAILVLVAVVAQAQLAPSWHGTWTANNKYGGVMYACPVGNRVFGVYSNAGFFIGTQFDRELEGNYWEGGRDDRNDWQGSFRIEISEDNQAFDGFWTRVTQDGREIRWHESRLGAPWPSNPTHEQCLVPDSSEALVGNYFRVASESAAGSVAGSLAVCKDEWSQIYGSMSDPDGYIEGWSVDQTTGFHGYRYDANGNSGAYILRATGEDELRGFYWKGRLARQNFETSQPEVWQRASWKASLSECQRVGPGFLRRLRGPTDDAQSSFAAPLVLIVATTLALLALF